MQFTPTDYGGNLMTKTRFTAIVRSQPSPFEGEYGRIVSKKLGKFVGKRVVVEIREAESKTHDLA
jgi:glycine cleavage system aminomethyltransferase T